TDVDRGIVSIILVAGIVTPCRIPVAIVKVVVTARDQLHPLITRRIPAPVMPFRMVRTIDLVLRPIPGFGTRESEPRVERNRWNPIRSRLRSETLMLLPDLLDLLCIQLLRGCRGRGALRNR